MSREIPGSAFEQGDGERRTWDEMGWWEQPFSADEDDYLADDEYVNDDEDDPTSAVGWLSGWSEPLTAARERWLLEDLDAEAGDLRERIYYRDMAAAAGGTVDETASAADKERLARLTEFRRQHPDPPADADEPEPPRPPDPPSAPVRPSRSGPVRMVDAALNEKLTPDELLHWQELQKGTKQTAIAEKLGIKQAAVSKRERKLRERIDAISIETIGRPYPERLVDRGMWARQGRRRNNSASRQR
ncbi:MAG: hypothetical protein ACRDGB_10950 [Candidatus Limnocylindria bacterium]